MSEWAIEWVSKGAWLGKSVSEWVSDSAW